MNQDRAEFAAELKNHGGYNCCQAVVAALADETNLPKEQLTQIAAGFCAGMGTMEATCGALVGAGIIAGLKTEGKATLKYTRQIAEKFKETSGAMTCWDLKRIGTGKVLCPCDDCVRNAVRAYEAVL